MELPSDSSDEGEITTTSVLLGYASEDPTGDDISYLGGSPSWLGSIPPPPRLVRCKVCQSILAQLLQLNGELPDHFPGHERRLHVFVCRKVACSRRGGSIRVIRSTKADSTGRSNNDKPSTSSLATDLGNTLFSATSIQPASSSVNPFSAGRCTTQSELSVPPVASLSSQLPTESYDTKDHEENVRNFHGGHVQQPSSTLNSMSDQVDASITMTSSALSSSSFPFYYLDAEREIVEPLPHLATRSTEGRFSVEMGEETDSVVEESRKSYESIVDKTFQRFADRLAQNPMQVLRYEFKGTPLLYSNEDGVGKLLSRRHTNSHGLGPSNPGIPRCTQCGIERVFELQLTPHAITEMERDEEGSNGMEWGTIILAVCMADCQPTADYGQVTYVEEWVGVQWEEKKMGNAL